MKNTRVVLADDHTLVRAGLKKLLESIPNCMVIGEAEDGARLISLAEDLQPDLVLIDISMPVINGLDATGRLVKLQPLLKIIILSMHHNDEYVRRALRQGAHGYLLKDAAPEELEAAIAVVMQGGTYLSPALTDTVLSDYVQRLRSEDSSQTRLTDRQREVLQLIAEGNSTKDIARRLSLSVKTIDSHRTQLMKQLDIHEVTGLVRYAARVGIITLDR
jgi:DNA-binding NarL/FixJ family response regulator